MEIGVMLWFISIWVVIYVIFLLLMKGFDSVFVVIEVSVLGDD